VFAFLAEHRRNSFPELMFVYMFPAAGGRPLVPSASRQPRPGARSPTVRRCGSPPRCRGRWSSAPRCAGRLPDEPSLHCRRPDPVPSHSGRTPSARGANCAPRQPHTIGRAGEPDLRAVPTGRRVEDYVHGLLAGSERKNGGRWSSTPWRCARMDAAVAGQRGLRHRRSAMTCAATSSASSAARRGGVHRRSMPPP
jgi:hypothetical protein